MIRTCTECTLKIQKAEGKSKLPNIYCSLECRVILTLVWRFWGDLVHPFWIWYYCENQWESLHWLNAVELNPREKTTHSKVSSPPCSKTGWSPGLVTALQPCRLTGSPAVLQRAHMLRTCRSHHAEGLRRGFRCSACSQEAENMSDKVQGSEYLTHPASQTRFCLGALEFTLTHSFCTTPYAGMGVDFGCTARLILPMYNPNFTVPSQGQCLERESKHIYNIIKVKACHNRVNE